VGIQMSFDELIQRGLVKQVTNAEAVAKVINTRSASFYIGFDPTADSLHVGHLLQIVTAKRLKDAGMFPIMLVGGATAQIGDPTGKSDMRKMLSEEELERNVRSIRGQIIKLLPGFISVVDNSSWTHDLNFMRFIREIGIHFSVSNMLRADCFKSRMENGGLSVLEFNYMLLQAFDFFHLFERQKCLLQVGGDDQWSNILAGIDLVHKKTGKQVFGLTLPLLTNAAGQKMGKTEKGAVWLDSSKTSIFDFFQFWRNLPDSDVIKCFKLLTFVSVEEIDAMPFSSVTEINFAKKRLAFELTKFVHGDDEAALALKQAEALFETNDASAVDTISVSDNTHVLELIIMGGFAKSRTEARNLINGRGISINDEVLTNPTITITKSQFGNDVVVKKGKKNFCRFTIKDSHV
jgi:tyrosyl-tRNA synthetase